MFKHWFIFLAILSLQNFVAAVCQVLAIPCKVCNFPGIGVAVCPQPIPVVCLVCAAKPLSVKGVTEYILSHNATIDIAEFKMPNETIE